MSKKYCIILIHEFPYYNGETFFDSELTYLSQEFDKITIFSIYGNKKEKYNRLIPNNVEIVPLNIKRGKIHNIFCGMFASKAKYPKCSSKHPKSLFFNLYFRGKNNQIINKTINYFKSNAFIEADDKIVIYSYWFNLSYPLLFLKQYFKKISNSIMIKCVSRAHGYDVYSERYNLKELPYQRESLSILDELHVCSKNGMEYLLKKYPSFANKIMFNYLGVEQTTTYLCKGDKNVFATCCSIRPIKRIDLFARAFCAYCKINASAKWICIGGGTDLDIIKKIICESHCNNNVIFTGEVSNKEVINLLRKHNVGFFFNVSIHEGLPVTLMEAQSLGIICVATDVGGNKEIINSSNGFLIPSNIDELFLTNLFDKLNVLDDNTLEMLSRNSYKNWDQYFNAPTNFKNWSKHISSFTDAYNKI